MAAYKQTFLHVEEDIGTVADVLVVADDYTDLADLSGAIEVGVFGIESTKHDIDLKTGQVAADELSFTIDETASESTDDSDAIAFVKAALDPGTPRYVARYINPENDPAEPSDTEFVGVIDPAFTATDILWTGAEYSTTPAPVRRWKLRARPYEIAEILSADMADVCDEILADTTWRAANVADRLGYFKDGTREARYAKLVSLRSLVQKILDTAAPVGFSITYDDSQPTDLYGTPGFFPVWSYAGEYLRVSFGTVNPPVRFQVTPDRYYRLQVGGDPDDEGSAFVQERVINPADDEESLSWRQFGTVGEFVAALAANFGLLPRITYTTRTDVVVGMVPRSFALSSAGSVYIRDALTAERSYAPVDTDRAKPFGAQSKGNREGYGTVEMLTETAVQSRSFYPWSGSLLRFPPGAVSYYLPVTLGGLVFWYSAEFGDGRDNGVDFADLYGTNVGEYPGGGNATIAAVAIPWNVAFYESGSPVTRGGDFHPTENLSDHLHAALYVRTVGIDDVGALGRFGYGTDSLEAYAPVTYFETKVGGFVRTYGHHLSTGFADWLADVAATVDEAAFEQSLTIEVPGLCGFRSTPTGSDDWRNLSLLTTTSIDGVDYVISSIERTGTRTKIRLDATSRFNFEDPEGAAIPDEPPAPSTTVVGPTGTTRRSFVAGEDIAAFQVVRVSPSDGQAYVAAPIHTNYRTVVGIAIADAADGDAVVVVQSGRVEIGDLLSGESPSIGDRVFLTTPSGSGTPNLTTVPLLASTGTEDLFVELGVLRSATVVDLSFPWNEYVIEPLSGV